MGYLLKGDDYDGKIVLFVFIMCYKRIHCSVAIYFLKNGGDVLL